MWVQVLFVLSQSMHLTYGQTDRWTTFSWLDRVACNVSSAVKTNVKMLNWKIRKSVR